MLQIEKRNRPPSATAGLFLSVGGSESPGEDGPVQNSQLATNAVDVIGEMFCARPCGIFPFSGSSFMRQDRNRSNRSLR